MLTQNSTESKDWKKLFTANTADAAITAGVATATEPTGDGVIKLRSSGSDVVPNNLLFGFFGEGVDGNAGNAWIEGWRKISNLYLPVPLLKLDLTLGTGVGVAAQAILNTENFVDTIAVTAGFEFTDEYKIISPATNLIALLKLDVFGCSHVQVKFAKGTATKLNGLWSTYG